MQRNFSVDDILGTFWKLDTQGDPKGAPPVVSIPEEVEEDDDDTHIPVVESLRTIEVDRGGMNRSASEYAFQEFLKVSESGGFARSKSRFMTNDGIRDKHHDDDDDDDDEEDDDTDPPSPASPESPNTSENTKAELSNQGSEELNHETGKTVMAMPMPMPASFILPKLEVRTISGVVDQEEVKDALHPLFSGIRDEVESAATATNSPQEYEYFLKHKLDIACAAVALSRSAAGGAKPEPPTSQSSFTPGAFGGAPIGIPALPPKPEYGAMVPPTRSRAITSGSDVSEDEESELGQNVAPGDVKRVKRMLSNRESARRSRRRKQAHLTELETQVAHLRAENSTIMKRVTDITLKFQEAAMENRVLKADVASLQAKLKVAESMVSGTNNGQQTASMDMPHSSGSRYMAYNTTGTNGPHYVQQQAPAVAVVQQQHQHEQQQQGFTGGKMGRTPSMQRVASLEHLQKRIRGGPACNNNPAWGGPFEADGQSMSEQHED